MKALSVMLTISCVSVLVYYYVPVIQLVAALDVILAAIAIVFYGLPQEVREEVLERFDERAYDEGRSGRSP